MDPPVEHSADLDVRKAGCDMNITGFSQSVKMHVDIGGLNHGKLEYLELGSNKKQYGHGVQRGNKTGDAWGMNLEKQKGFDSVDFVSDFLDLAVP